MKKEGKDYFLKEATKKFGDRFQYNLDNFNNFRTEIEITDLETGETFIQSPKNHLRSKTGKPDTRFKPKNSPVIKEDEFKEKINLIFGGNIEIVGEFKGIDYPIKVRCNKHNNEFDTIPKNLLHNHNKCPDCYKEKLSNSSRTKKVDWENDNEAREQLRQLINAGYTFVKIGEIFDMSAHQIGVIAKRYNFNKPNIGEEVPIIDENLLVFNKRLSTKESECSHIMEKYSKEELKDLLIKYSESNLPGILSIESSSLRLAMERYGLDYSEILKEEKEREHKKLSVLIQEYIDKGYSNFAIAPILGISELLIQSVEKEFNITPKESPKRINVFDKDFILTCIDEGMSDAEITKYYIGDYAKNNLKRFMIANGIENPNNKKIIQSYGNEYVESWLKTNNFTNFIRELKITPDKIFGKSGNGIFVDFSVTINNDSYWIEYNGKQHYELAFFHKAGRRDQSFVSQLKRDAEERKYCKENNIILIEIPYIFNTYKKIGNFLNKVLLQHIDPNTLVNYSELYKLENTGLNLVDLFPT